MGRRSESPDDRLRAALRGDLEEITFTPAMRDAVRRRAMQARRLRSAPEREETGYPRWALACAAVAVIALGSSISLLVFPRNGEPIPRVVVSDLPAAAQVYNEARK